MASRHTGIILRIETTVLKGLKLINSFYHRQRVFPTAAHCKTMMLNTCVYAAGNWQQGIMAVTKKRSKTWLHFNSAACNVCKMMISTEGGNTSNMQKHLSTQHEFKFQECYVVDTLCTTSATEGKYPFDKISTTQAGLAGFSLTRQI